MHKNLSYLNSKWWYRLIKVFYLSFFSVVFAVSIFNVFDIYGIKDVDYSKSELLCNNGVSKKLGDINLSTDYGYDELVSLGAKDFSIDSYRSLDLDTISLDNRLKQICLSDSDLGKIIKKQYPKSVSTSGVEYQNFSDDKLGKLVKEKNNSSLINTSFVNNNYTLKIIRKSHWFKIINNLILNAFLVCATAEGLRRVFYYIVLGDFFPKK